MNWPSQAPQMALRILSFVLLLLSGTFGAQNLQAQIITIDDIIFIEDNQESFKIDVLANDVGTPESQNAMFLIPSEPALGQANLAEDDLTIVYTPSASENINDYFDIFTYTILEEDEIVTGFVFVVSGDIDLNGDSESDNVDTGDNPIINDSIYTTYTDLEIYSSSYQVTEICDVTSCVWPGDANYDGQANVWDLLPLGQIYGTSGPPRFDGNGEWEAQYGFNWNGEQNNGSNYKHIDCDGNGVVNMLDIIAINQNYSNTQNKTGSEESEGDVELTVKILNETISEGDTITAQIHIDTENAESQDIYGLAYSLSYNAPLVKANTIKMAYEDCFLGTTNELLWLTKDFHVTGRVESGITRMDLVNANGSGIIGTVSFVMEDVLLGKSLDGNLNISFENVTVVRNNGNEVPVQLSGDSRNITFTGIERAHWLESDLVNLFPNPVANSLQIEIQEAQPQQMEIIGINGQVVHQQDLGNGTNFIQLNTSNYNNGLYLLKLYTEEGLIQKRFNIVK